MWLDFGLIQSKIQIWFSCWWLLSEFYYIYFFIQVIDSLSFLLKLTFGVGFSNEATFHNTHSTIQTIAYSLISKERENTREDSFEISAFYVYIFALKMSFGLCFCYGFVYHFNQTNKPKTVHTWHGTLDTLNYEP